MIVWLTENWRLLAVTAIAMLFVYLVSRNERLRDLRQERLMSECVEDGLKEYECESMLRAVPATGGSVIVLPLNPEGEQWKSPSATD